MPEEAAFLEVLQRTAAVPRTLTLRHEHDALRIGSRAARTAQPAAHRDHRPRRRHLHRPAAEQVVRLVGAAQAQRDPQVPLGIGLRGEGELVAFRIAPVARQGIVAVGRAVTVGVRDARDLAPCRRQHGAVAPCQGEDLVLTGGEEVILRLRRRFHHALHEVDVAAPRADREAAVGQKCQAAGPHGHGGRDGNGRDRVVLRLRGGGAPHFTEIFLAAQRQGGESEDGQ